MTAREIAQIIFNSPINDGKAKESIDRGEELILKFAQEQAKIFLQPDVSGSADTIPFAEYLSGHDTETIKQMYNDWRHLR